MACWLDPHWRSTVVAGVVNGKARATSIASDVQALLAGLGHDPKDDVLDLSGLMPARCTTSLRTSDPSTTGCTSLSFPLRRTDRVRTASTIRLRAFFSGLQ